MLIKAQSEYGIVFRNMETMFGYQGWPSVCKNKEGALVAVFSGFRVRHVCPFGKTAACVSRDEGKTWTPPFIINDTPLDDRDAGILNIGGNGLLVTWFSHPAHIYEKEYLTTIKDLCTIPEAAASMAMVMGYQYLSDEQRRGGSFIRLSRDGGVTWGKTIRVPVSSPHGPNLLSDGSILYFGKEMFSEGALEEGTVAAYHSVDGENWTMLSKVAVPEGCIPDNMQEPHVLELPNGRLLGAIRAQGSEVYHSFTIFTCFSDDRGHSWTVPKSLDVPGSPPHLLLHSSGAVICTFGRREAPYGERALVSYDNGESWEDEYIIDDRADCGDLGYPATAEMPDGSLITVYYQRYPGDNKPSILCAKWRLKK